MPISNKELVAEQKRRLYPLAYVYKVTDDEKAKAALREFIEPLVTEMDEEDVAFVEKKVDQRLANKK